MSPSLHMLMILWRSKYLPWLRFNTNRYVVATLLLPITYYLRKSIVFKNGTNLICNQVPSPELFLVTPVFSIDGYPAGIEPC